MPEQDACPGPIFCQPWWLDAVAENRWGVVEIKNRNELTARMPFVWNERAKSKLIMPKLTQTLGPWVDLGSGKRAKRLERHKDLMQQLIDQLPAFTRFHQNFHYTIDNWLPWYWRGFQQTTRYTYVIEDLSSLERVWDDFATNIRRNIRKAEKQVEVEVPACPREFFELNELVFKRQSKAVPYSRAFVEKLDDACARRNRRKIFLARGKDGKPHAGCYLVWDRESAYYLMGGGDPELRRSGATSLCMWKAIQFASQITGKFDFEGSMLEPVERFFRSFGAIPKPYFKITKSNTSKAARLGHQLLRRTKQLVTR